MEYYRKRYRLPPPPSPPPVLYPSASKDTSASKETVVLTLTARGSVRYHSDRASVV